MALVPGRWPGGGKGLGARRAGPEQVLSARTPAARRGRVPLASVARWRPRCIFCEPANSPGPDFLKSPAGAGGDGSWRPRRLRRQRCRAGRAQGPQPGSHGPAYSLRSGGRKGDPDGSRPPNPGWQTPSLSLRWWPPLGQGCGGCLDRWSQRHHVRVCPKDSLSKHMRKCTFEVML